LVVNDELGLDTAAYLVSMYKRSIFPITFDEAEWYEPLLIKHDDLLRFIEKNSKPHVVPVYLPDFTSSTVYCVQHFETTFYAYGAPNLPPICCAYKPANTPVAGESSLLPSKKQQIMPLMFKRLVVPSVSAVRATVDKERRIAIKGYESYAVKFNIDVMVQDGRNEEKHSMPLESFLRRYGPAYAHPDTFVCLETPIRQDKKYVAVSTKVVCEGFLRNATVPLSVEACSAQ
jgi:hypothetical protein